MPQPEPVECWACTHDVDEHDVRARCLQPTCGCGWEPMASATRSNSK